MVKQPKFQAVLFDLDGTLLDTAPDFLTCTNRLLDGRGMPLLTEDDIRKMVTHGSAGIISQTFSLHNSHPDFEPLRQELLSLYMDNLAEQTLGNCDQQTGTVYPGPPGATPANVLAKHHHLPGSCHPHQARSGIRLACIAGIGYCSRGRCLYW